MKTKKATDYLSTVFHYCLLGLFLYSSFTLFFIFVLNWEARFFGMKLDGLPAGLLLLIRVLIPAVLALFLIRYPEKILPVAVFTLVFYGFFFIDSSVTIQRNTGGMELFGIIPLVSVLIPAVIVIGHLFVVRFRDRTDE
jgi:hypothetical protein